MSEVILANQNPNQLMPARSTNMVNARPSGERGKTSR